MSSINEMPNEVQVAFDRARVEGSTYWVPIVRLAITKGVIDPNKLADIPFFLERPKMRPRALREDEDRLKRAWYHTRSNLIPYIQAVRRSMGEADLTAMLSYIKVDWLKPKWEHSNAMVTNERKKDKKKLLEFMKKASAAPHEYATVYRTYICNDFSGSHSPTNRRRQVDSFKRSSAINALQSLQNTCGDLSKKGIEENVRGQFVRAFGDLEFSVYSNIEVASRWVKSGATNDGPTASVQMEKELEWMLAQSRRKKSIYSAYEGIILNTYKILHDSSPRTSGLWDGFGTWEQWKHNFGLD